VKFLDLFKYFFEHIEELRAVAVLMSGGIFYSVIFFKRMISNRVSSSFLSPKMKKSIFYLKKCENFLDDEDKKFLELQVNNEIMKSIMGGGFTSGRKDLIFIRNRIDNLSTFNKIVNLKSHLLKNNEGSYFIAKKHSKKSIVWHFISLFGLGAGTLIYLFIGITFWQKSNYIDSLIFSFFGFVFEVAFLWYSSIYASNKEIDFINSELSKVKVVPADTN